MASTETQHGGSVRGIGRLLHRKKDPDSAHSLIHPSAADSVGPTNQKKKNHRGRGFPFGGLGCSSSSSSASPEALVPAASAAASAVRSSADWQGKRIPGKRRGKKMKTVAAKKVGAHPPPADVADVSDLWCAPGVVFGADASVDCVVAHRRERPHRERACNTRRGIEEEVISSFLDCPFTMDMRHFGSGSLHSGHLRFGRGGYRPSPDEFDEEMMMFQTRVFLGGMDVHDQYKDLRLDVDNMSYEELLELSERIGYVSTGLREEEILRNLGKPKHLFSSDSPAEKEWKCIICQEEYEVDDDVGRLECSHSYHTYCIKQWLLRKNACPVCKTAVTKS